MFRFGLMVLCTMVTVQRSKSPSALPHTPGHPALTNPDPLNNYPFIVIILQLSEEVIDAWGERGRGEAGY